MEHVSIRCDCRNNETYEVEIYENDTKMSECVN